jgi:DNA repair protein RadC
MCYVLKGGFSEIYDMMGRQFVQLMETDGIRFQDAYKIKATFEVTKRIAAYCEEDHPKITSKDDVTKFLFFFFPLFLYKLML